MDQFVIQRRDPVPPAQPDKRPQNLARCSGEFAPLSPEPGTEEYQRISDEFLRIALASDKAANAELQDIRAKVVEERQASLTQPSGKDTIELLGDLVARIEFHRVCLATMDRLIAEGAWRLP